MQSLALQFPLPSVVTSFLSWALASEKVVAHSLGII